MEKGHQYLRGKRNFIVMKFLVICLVLGVSISATEKDIKNAYRKKARDLHPDKNPSPEGKDSIYEAIKAISYIIMVFYLENKILLLMNLK